MKIFILTLKDMHEQDGEKSESEFSAVCSYEGDENSYSLSYNESGFDPASSQIKIKVTDKKRVEVLREGAFNTQLIIEEGVRHTCFYETPYGEFTIGVYAESVRSQIGENGGTLELSYSLDFNSGLASKNKMTITLKEAADNVTAC